MKMKTQVVKKDYIVGCLFFMKKMRGEMMERTEVSSSNIESIVSRPVNFFPFWTV